MTAAEHDPDLVAKIAALISGAPSPSTRSQGKARKILDLLQAEAEREEREHADRMIAETKLAGMDFKGGEAVVTALPPHELVVTIASAMAETLGDAPNYRETEFRTPSTSMDVHPADGPWFVLTVQRKGGKTPAQLRREAEEEAERLRAQIGQLHDALDAAVELVNDLRLDVGAARPVVTPQRIVAWEASWQARA